MVLLGSYGVKEVAVKLAAEKSPVKKERFAHEIAILEGCRDPRIVQYLGARIDRSCRALLLVEYMPGGNLYTAIGDDWEGKYLWKNKRVLLLFGPGLQSKRAFMRGRHCRQTDLAPF